MFVYRLAPINPAINSPIINTATTTVPINGSLLVIFATPSCASAVAFASKLLAVKSVLMSAIMFSPKASTIPTTTKATPIVTSAHIPPLICPFLSILFSLITILSRLGLSAVNIYLWRG